MILEFLESHFNFILYLLLFFEKYSFAWVYYK